ncbi:MAG: PAS domain S-box protein, partial [Smithella sp.]
MVVKSVDQRTSPPKKSLSKKIKIEKTDKNKTGLKNSGTLRMRASGQRNSGNEERYRNILENMNDGCFELDLAGNFTFFNDSVCRVLGYSREELMGTNYRCYVGEENDRKLFQTLNKVYETGKPLKEINSQIMSKNGTKRYIEGSISLRKDSTGKPVGFQGIVNNVTERRRIQEELRKSELAFRSLFEASPVGIFKTVDRKFVQVNPALCRTIGYSPEELIGQSVRIGYRDEEEYERAGEILYGQVLQEGKGFVEAHLKRKNGDDFEGLLYFSPIDPQDFSAGFEAIMMDITERKQAEEALKRSEAQYRLLADHMKDQVLLMDLDLKWTYISPSVEKLWGYTLEEIIALPLDNFLTPSSFQRVMAFFASEMPKGLAAPPTYLLKRLLELECRCKDGRTIWIESSFSFIRDENGRPVSLLGEGRDITERKQMEDSLRKSEQNFRHTLDDSPLGVRISTIEGETIYANRAILDMYGYDSIEELKKIQLKERYTSKSYAEFQIRKEKRLRGEPGPSEYEISIVRKNGEIRHLHVLRKEIFWNGQKQSQVIYQDITLRRQAEKKLNETLENLRQSIKTTIQVLGTASEARDPYTAGHQKRVANLARAIATEM